MSGHRRRTVERHSDVCIVGGDPAALAAAEQFTHGPWAVTVIDADGLGESDARERVRRYGGEILAARVTRVIDADDKGVQVELVGGHTIVARRLLSTSPTLDTPPRIVRLAPRVNAADNRAVVADTVASLSAEDEQAGNARRSANQLDWDRRYASRQMWSGNPNGTLVHEAERLTPGRALDVGAGEGGDAIWLAEHGWRVVASDIAQPALDRIAAEAARRGLEIECLPADANAEAPFADAAFELVSAQYASIPRTPDARGVRNLMSAVAPGGRLLIVSHDLEPMRAPIDTRVESRIFDPDAYVRIDDFAVALTDEPGWTVELCEQRARPAGAASSHHVDDLVLRARRD
jgi:SAM-dependent methyltransferase